MHELSLTQNILEISLKHAGAKTIIHVNLLVGEYADEREDAIRFYWQGLAKGTQAEHAELHFRPARAEMKCLDCEAIFHPGNEEALCPNCQSYRLQLISGDDVRLESIDVD